jgi:hypothetical protein
MGIAYRADRSLGCTVSVWDGNISANDIQQHLIHLAGNGEWPPGQLHLTDLTTVGDVTVPDPELVELLYEGTDLAEELKVTVLVRPDSVHEPDLRFASAAHEIRATTFTDIRDACAYLGISTVDAQAIIQDLRTTLAEPQT